MLLNLTEFSTSALHYQIADQIILKVVNGELVPGDEIESVGVLAREQHVGKKTAKKAYEELEKLNILEFKKDYGYYLKKISEEKLKEYQKKIQNENAYSMLKGSDLTHSTDLMIEDELKHARKIQADLSPQKPLDDNNIRINAFINPSRVVCGDFYDYFKIDDKKYGLVIADASGKGMPAAILISQIQAILKSEMGNGTSLVSVIDKMNKHLVANSNARNFTSIFYGIYDVSNKNIEYVNAGHNCPILVLSDGSFVLLKTTCPALGLLKDLKISTSTLSVQSESILMCYTDGVTETMNKVEEQFGEGRLIELIVNNRNLEPDNIIELVETGLNNFRSEKFINDDRTIMVARIK